MLRGWWNRETGLGVPVLTATAPQVERPAASFVRHNSEIEIATTLPAALLFSPLTTPTILAGTMAYRLAALALGLLVGAYWLRVIRMARKARKKTGRAANFLPPEMVGRVLRVVWIPVVVGWVGQVAKWVL